jgi:hypothetical protein
MTNAEAEEMITRIWASNRDLEPDYNWAEFIRMFGEAAAEIMTRLWKRPPRWKRSIAVSAKRHL